MGHDISYNLISYFEWIHVGNIGLIEMIDIIRNMDRNISKYLVRDGPGDDLAHCIVSAIFIDKWKICSLVVNYWLHNLHIVRVIILYNIDIATDNENFQLHIQHTVDSKCKM